MATKEKPTNINTNNNTNNVNVKVSIDNKPYSEKKSKPNWYLRTILGGIIALVLALIYNYVNNDLTGKGQNPATLVNQPIEGVKQ